ncbi:MAG: DegT/DnrJ/EryC1/StrS family aminotransferase [Desulfobacterales bacterium]|nr:DegT/DnrJ/EryC1/StrS family aminotransferase [Desulfobacterales bacterium]
MAEKEFIPVCEPLLAGNELEYVQQAVSTGWISSSGGFVTEFEKKFAEFCGVRFGVTTNTGTAALHLACVAAGIGPGDEVIIPSFTMISTAFAVCYCGATPVFVDCERETWNIDITRIEEKISRRTRAILPVHIYGHPCDMDPILEIARHHNLLVIEDAAEVHGAEYKGRRCGSLGDLGCFSFFANKIVTTGEGGMVVTDNAELRDRCRYYKNLAFPLEGARDYRHEHIGFNYRMSNLIAALGVAQTEKAAEYAESRQRNARLYRQHLQGTAGISFQQEKEWAKSVSWMFGILIEDDFGPDRDEVATGLREAGIDSRFFFTPMHLQPSLRNHGCDCSGTYPVAEEIGRRGLYLPSGSGLGEARIDRVCEALLALRG